MSGNATSALGLGRRFRLEQPSEPFGEQVGVARPARGQVVTVLDDKGGAVVRGGAPPLGVGAADELARVVQRSCDLVLDVRRVRSVVATQPPRREVVRPPFHVLRQAGGPPIRDHAPPGATVAGAGQHEDAVANRADRPTQRPELGHLALEHRRGEVLAHARRVAAREQQTVIVGRSKVRPAQRLLKRRRLDELPVEGLRLFVGPGRPR